MSNSTYKLIYFNIKGVAECVRYMFAYADVPFIDFRITKDEWENYKEQQPFGKIPVLTVEGKQLSQSVAICRFLGKRFGLVTDNEFKNALLEAVVDNMRDVHNKLAQAAALKSAEVADEAEKGFHYVYRKLEPLVSDGYFYGSEPTWVDVYFAGMLDSILTFKPNYLDPYPNLTALLERIRSKESVIKYLENRSKP